MTTPRTLLTVEDLLRLPPIEGRRELLDGKVVEMSPAGGEHNYILNKFAFRLTEHIEPRGLGVVLSGDTGVVLARNPDRVRAPDICFIAADRLSGGRVPKGFLEIVPDLIVEIVSPNDSAASVQAKMEEWLRAGARLVWALFPATRTVHAATSLDAIEVYREGDILTGAPVLPEFAVQVRVVFE